MNEAGISFYHANASIASVFPILFLQHLELKQVLNKRNIEVHCTLHTYNCGCYCRFLCKAAQLTVASELKAGDPLLQAPGEDYVQEMLLFAKPHLYDLLYKSMLISALTKINDAMAMRVLCNQKVLKKEYENNIRQLTLRFPNCLYVCAYIIVHHYLYNYL